MGISYLQIKYAIQKIVKCAKLANKFGIYKSPQGLRGIILHLLFIPIIHDVYEYKEGGEYA